MFLSYGDLVCLAFGIGIIWFVIFYILLHILEKMGFISRNDQG